MNQQQFYRWMDSPAELGTGSLPALQQLLDDYPYFQAAHTLYLLNLRLVDDYRFSSRLRTCAVYSPDRVRLRQWVTFIDNLAAASGESARETIEIPEPTIAPENPKLKSIEQEIKESLREIEERQLRLNKLMEEKKSIIGESLEREQRETDQERASMPRPLPKDDLLEDFIKAGATRERSPASFFSPEESARRSIEENYSVISETLARLIAAQGKYEEAIKIYQQLMLKNPQKSSYFAAQIEKLRKEL